MHSYLLTEEQLVENGYPRPTGDSGVASIVRKPDDVSDIKPVGPNGMVLCMCLLVLFSKILVFIYKIMLVHK